MILMKSHLSLIASLLVLGALAACQPTMPAEQTPTSPTEVAASSTLRPTATATKDAKEGPAPMLLGGDCLVAGGMIEVYQVVETPGRPAERLSDQVEVG